MVNEEMETERIEKKKTPNVISFPVSPNSVVRWFEIKEEISVIKRASPFNKYTFERPDFNIESYCKTSVPIVSCDMKKVGIQQTIIKMNPRK